MQTPLDTTLTAGPGVEHMQTPLDTTLTAGPGVERAAWTVDALRSVWGHQQGRVNERIETIDRALTVLASGGLDGDLRREAQRAAHMLAGSLGMFGFVRAARAARSLELELARASSEHAPVLCALLTSVRNGVVGPVGLPTISSH